MTDLRKAAEMALDWMERYESNNPIFEITEPIQALRQALAMERFSEVNQEIEEALKQPKREWVGLTEADKQEAFDETQEASGGFWEFANYLEAKLKEKNT